ncbi:MAG TPA: ADOP family duplicated permease [Acidobacteriota bacterium]|nr:ADOP family duplicated permease [Acidobacteriota bacterium]
MKHARLKHRQLAIRLARSSLTQKQWAERLGISATYLSQLLHGKRAYPAARVRRRLLRELEADFEQLFRWETASQEDVTAGERSGSSYKRVLEWHPGSWRLRLERRRDTGPIPSRGLFMSTLAWILDLRDAARALRRRPRFTLACILVLALGIAVSTAFFGVFDLLLLRPLPYPQANHIVRVFSYNEGSDPFQSFRVISYPEFEDIQSGGFLSQAGLYDLTNVTLTGSGPPRQMTVARVSAGMLETLGAVPRPGRLFSSAEHQSPAPRSVLVSARLLASGALPDNLAGSWDASMAPDTQAAPLYLDGQAYSVAGVLPRDFRMPHALWGGRQVDIWMPLGATSRDYGRGIRRFAAYGRLTAPPAKREDAESPATSLSALRSRLDQLSQRLRAQYPESTREKHLYALSLGEIARRPVLPLLTLLGALCAALLLVTCSNAASLILARNVARRREFALRQALGSGSLRLLRGLTLEGLLLGLAAALPAIALAYLLSSFLRLLAALNLPRMGEVSLDARVLLFALGLSLLTGLASGLAPAFPSLGRRAAYALGNGRQESTSHGQRRLLGALVIGQLALSLVFVVACGLLTGTLWNLSQVDPGLNAEGVLTAQLRLPDQRYGEDEQARAFWSELRQQSEHLESVSAAGAVNWLPLGSGWSCDTFAVADRPQETQDCAEFRISTPGYFQALGIPLLQGRLFEERDDASAPPVVIVSRSLAQRLWPGESALGRRVRYGSPTSSGPWHTVVGVVGDVRHFGLEKRVSEELHFPHRQAPYTARNMTLVVRGRPGSDLAGQLRGLLGRLDPQLAVSSMRPMQDWLADSTSRPRSLALLLAGLGSAALLLAIAGVYGVIAFVMRRRLHEFGVRLALGARRRHIRQLVLRRALLWALSASVLGLPAAWASARLLESDLFGISPQDPLVLTAAPLLVVAVSLCAALAPARRASHTDPSASLRAQ